MDNTAQLVEVDDLMSFLANLFQHSQDDLRFAPDAASRLRALIRNPAPQIIHVYTIAPSTISVSEEVPPASDHVTVHDTLMIVKARGELRACRSLTSQITYFNLPTKSSAPDQPLVETSDPHPDVDAFSNLSCFVNYGLFPYFDALAGNGYPNTIATARKKLTEFALTLQDMHLRIQAPDLIRLTHPRVAQLIDSNETQYQTDALIADSTFLNELTQIALDWIRQIQACTNMSHIPVDGDSISSQILFWKSMDAALTDLSHQINSPQVTKSIEILNKGKRFHVTLGFLNDLGLSEKMSQAKVFNGILKELPINSLSTCPDTDFEAFISCTSLLFDHLKQKLNGNTSVPAARAVAIVDSVLSDITTKFSAVLSSLSLLALDRSAFTNTLDTIVSEGFNRIDLHLKFLANLFRDLLRKRPQKSGTAKIKLEQYSQLKLMVEHSKQVYYSHQSLLDAAKVIFTDSMVTIQLATAYDEFLIPSCPFASTAQGKSIWKLNENAYLETYHDINRRAQNRVLELFENASFRDHVSISQQLVNYTGLGMGSWQHLINDSQRLKLLQVANNEVRSLVELDNSFALSMQQFVAVVCPGGVIPHLTWSILIQHKVSFYTTNLSVLLGDDWSQYHSAGQLHADLIRLFNDTNPQRIADSCLPSIEKTLAGIADLGKVLHVENIHDTGWSIQVCFDSAISTATDQARAITDFGLKVPPKTQMHARRASNLVRVAADLSDAVNLLKALLAPISDVPDANILIFILNPHKRKVAEALRGCMDLEWKQLIEDLDLVDICERLELAHSLDNGTLLQSHALNKVNDLQTLILSLFNFSRHVSVLEDLLLQTLYDLETCTFDADHLRIYISQLNDSLKQFDWGNDAENSSTVRDIANFKISTVLTSRCELEIHALQNLVTDQYHPENLLESRTICSISLKGADMVVLPPISLMKSVCADRISSILTAAESQTKISARGEDDHYVVSSQAIDVAIRDTLVAADEKICDAEQYVAFWKSIIVAWNLDLSIPHDFAKIIPPDADLTQWLRLASDSLAITDVLNSPDSQRTFGALLAVNHASAKSMAISCHEAFRTTLLSSFCTKLGIEIANMGSDMQSSISPLEYRLPFNGRDSELIKMLTLIIDTELCMQLWRDRISLMKTCQTLLFKFNYRLPGDWEYVESLENKLAFAEALMKKKMSDIESHMSSLLTIMDNEAKRLDGIIKSEVEDWNQKKPVGAQMSPTDALSILHIFTQKIASLSQSHADIHKISAKWNTAKPCDSFVIRDLTSEIDQLKLVWSSIHLIWQSTRNLESTLWSAISIKDLRRVLDSLLKDAKKIPLEIRQYDAFESVHSCLITYSKNLPSLVRLKSQSLGPRHWALLFETVGLPETQFDQLTVEHVLKIDFSLHDQTLKSIIQRAEAESAIANELAKIESEWHLVRFDMFNHKDKCRLVKNWATIFEQCNNDIGALSSMEASPFYSTFEIEITELAKKLNKLYVLLDVWVDVQRQWIYLDGIFGSNNGIQQLLPIESSRFVNLTFEFHDLLKKLNKSSLVIEVLDVPQAQDGMARLQEGLVRIRKSLTDYLERQRGLFPRFYFVGNEDLLEIIAAPTNISAINQHFKKMFLGVDSVGYDEASSTIYSVISAQGEVVTLAQPICLYKTPRLEEWLSDFQDGISATLKTLTSEAVICLAQVFHQQESKPGLDAFCRSFPAQVCTLALQILCTREAEKCIAANDLKTHVGKLGKLLAFATTLVGETEESLQSTKFEHLIIELIHQHEIAQQLMQSQLKSEEYLSSFWYMQQKFYICEDAFDEPAKFIKIRHADFSTFYGFEYLGVTEKLAYTPLMEKCYVAMAQALNQKKGGSPFGSAGTGKTESVKALGHSLGKMVMVFCCDESFDYESVQRLLIGLCKVGCWGCFDEFNRLEENILSAVSSLIEGIEDALGNPLSQLTIAGSSFDVNPQTGIFITMNPGYAGRVELPDGLRKQFRSFSMEVPDKERIIHVLLASRAFHHASKLASSICAFFEEFESQVSKQLHYDFGLRTIKTVLDNCGRRKRTSNYPAAADLAKEYEYVLHSIIGSLAPRLLAPDEALLLSLLSKHFPEYVYDADIHGQLSHILCSVATRKGLTACDDWLKKAVQLYEAQISHVGIMLVGDAGSGKTALWTLVLSAMGEMENRDTLHYVIDCKVTSKEEVYGRLDEFTRDWTDGIFTSILRKVRANLRDEQSKIVWIVFDGDVDPLWIENLNSVLDDNRILTLPNGERIRLPSNMRLVFETDSLKYTTPATVSRCSMIWMDGSLIQHDYLFKKRIALMCTRATSGADGSSVLYSYQDRFCDYVLRLFDRSTLMQLEKLAGTVSHVMHYTTKRCINTLSVLLSHYLKKYGNESAGYPSLLVIFEKYLGKASLLSAIWAFAGDSTLEERESFGDEVARLDCFKSVDPIIPGSHHIDYDITVSEAEWIDWRRMIGHVELDTQQLAKPNTIVPTIDTVRHEQMIFALLSERLPVLLCGPPGSGKTMTLLESLRQSSKFDLISLNFSKETTPQALMRSLDQFCVYKKTSGGLELAPRVNGRWVVVFCDEINLPQTDKYGTQIVISLLRQMIEHNGFWAKGKNAWVKLSNIQFVAACNLPSDPGRIALTDRFLRHGILIMVDYPGVASLKIIYDTFNSAVMKTVPDLRGYASTITDAMLRVYGETTDNISSLMQDHYIYSPRELTRWSKGLLQGLRDSKIVTPLQLVRLWYHEGLRLFYDRLIGDWERQWTKTLFKEVIAQFFPNIDVNYVLEDPVFFSNWLSSSYESVPDSKLRTFVAERLKVFVEEEGDVNLVLHEGLLDHCLRIDRVLKHPQGHMILAGPCTSGKTTLTKFVAWINGLSVFHLSVYSEYTIEDFDLTLREILMRCVYGERICFIIDDSSILKSAFIERMNTLLANAEIPGLFEGDDYTDLMKACLKSSHAQGLLLDTDEELNVWFTKNTSATLHVVLNVSLLKNSGLRPTVVTSPALFNRCVFNWMGDWSNVTLQEIGDDLINSVPLDMPDFEILPTLTPCPDLKIVGFRDVIIDALVFAYRHILEYTSLVAWGRVPGNFIESVRAFVSIFERNLIELDREQRHTITGLDKLKEAVVEVNSLKADLSHMQTVLAVKEKEANIMLNKMLTEQNEAERKQEFSIEIQLELEKQEHEIERRKSVVIKDLQVAEPAVLEAQRGVQNIKKQHLTEIRSMSNPPAAVKMTMESVCNLIGFAVSSWRDVQLVVRRDDFIANIVSFDNERQLTAEVRVFMEKHFLSREDYNYEAVNRASKACGPLLQWVVAQLTYSRILKEVGPLREEVVKLESSALKTRAQLIAIDEMIHELEELIESLKNEYSKLIREAENIKQEAANGKSKIAKSLLLIESLTAEKDRWRRNVQQSGKQRQQITGNALLAAMHTTYAGAYDQKGRQMLWNAYTSKLKSSGIPFDSQLSVSSMMLNFLIDDVFTALSSIGGTIERDNLAIIGSCQNPVIVDPSGQALDMLSLLFKPRKVTRTSFSFPGFVKVVENALRFGGIVVLEDAENYDPILAGILRGDVRREGGRAIVRLGEVEVDYSPQFKLIMFTRHSKIVLPPFVESRTRFVDFTVTSGSLEEKALDTTLCCVHPDVEEKRVELIRLQGEYQARMIDLERLLLVSLSGAEGRIVENETILSTLEELKSESMAVDTKIRESQDVLLNLNIIRDKFRELGLHAAAIFAALSATKTLNRFYIFTLPRFLDVLFVVLRNRQSDASSDLVTNLYRETFAVAASVVANEDRVVLAILLATCFYKREIGSHAADGIETALECVTNEESTTKSRILDICLARYDSVDLQSIEQLRGHNKDNASLQVIAPLYDAIPRGDAILLAFESMTKFIFPSQTSFGTSYDLEFWSRQLGAMNVPILLVSSDGCDAKSTVERLAVAQGRLLALVSMGSKESIENANKALREGALRGSWVLIQNVHMSPQWVGRLEHWLGESTPEPGFRLFITCKQTFKQMPAALLQQCQVMYFESMHGLRNALLQTYGIIARDKLMSRTPLFRHIYFLMVVFYSVLQERTRYVPGTFAKNHDINDSDFIAGFSVLERALCGNSTSDTINWASLQYLIATIAFGAKINDAHDLAYVQTLAEHLFNPKSLATDYNLIPQDNGEALLRLPENMSCDSFNDWLSRMSENEAMMLLGLPDNAESRSNDQKALMISARALMLMKILPTQ